MSEMIDRVASAVLAEAYKTGGVNLRVGVARAVARAAIKAMREPGDADFNGEFGKYPRQMFSEMIDAALK